MEGTDFIVKMTTYDKHTDSIILNRIKLEAILLKSGIVQGYPLSPHWNPQPTALFYAVKERFLRCLCWISTAGLKHNDPTDLGKKRIYLAYIFWVTVP